MSDKHASTHVHFRKCSATNRLITSTDHSSVQVNVGHLDANGIYTGQYTPLALCGFIRFQAEADSAMNRLATDAGLMKDFSTFPKESKIRK